MYHISFSVQKCCCLFSSLLIITVSISIASYVATKVIFIFTMLIWELCFVFFSVNRFATTCSAVSISFMIVCIVPILYFCGCYCCKHKKALTGRLFLQLEEHHQWKQCQTYLMRWTIDISAQCFRSLDPYWRRAILFSRNFTASCWTKDPTTSSLYCSAVFLCLFYEERVTCCRADRPKYEENLAKMKHIGFI